jgi:superfamily II helicase
LNIISAPDVKKNSELQQELAKDILESIQKFLSSYSKDELIQKAADLSSDKVALELVEKRLEGRVYTHYAERFLIREYFSDFYKYLEEQRVLAKYKDLLPIETMKEIMAWELVLAWRVARSQSKEKT